ncbi:hypothetical protein TBR22_A12860 [Luteitalea sp. TBR-22]|uniref:hypothetical protein n=1 Tax=Luteitalea sp. TBR-22 TaxID=2802971 RepID=UPI001AF58CC1|nr:hypothetical protein [Luteitalea sp. TBR-22]BCS32080.1 hypothetical protein TBR22_A12860 [Luteitalea sp. TBR-22]
MENRAFMPRKVRMASVDARKLVTEWSAVLDQALSRRLAGRAYVTADGKVILLPSRSAYANVYESRDEVEAWLADVFRRAQAAPHLSTLIPSGRDFGSCAPALAEGLLQNLGIASRAYEPSLLGAVEKRLRSIPREEVMRPPLLESIMALVGECIRTQVKGSTWWMRDTDEGWEPLIVSSERRVTPVLRSYKELLERFPAPSLRTYVEWVVTAPQRWIPIEQTPARQGDVTPSQ